MFTGIVEATGTVHSVSSHGTGRRLAIEHSLLGLCVGESISCNGVCLTVEQFSGEPGAGGTFQVNAGEETLERTTVAKWLRGSRVHLERALRASDRMGGHVVTGHVDLVAKIDKVEAVPGFSRIFVSLPPSALPSVVAKGSVAVDGVSLTVNAVDARGFSVGIIPHTLAVTHLGALREGDAVNVELDILGKYVARWLDARGSTP
jgi:riboflavin synthase